MKDLECSGGEIDISRCTWQQSDEACATHDLDSLVYCALESDHSIFAEGQLRLIAADGAPSADGNGRLEIFRAGAWGSVCGVGITAGSAAVACKQMGSSGGQVDATSTACGGLGGACQEPHISELSCAGTESN